MRSDATKPYQSHNIDGAYLASTFWDEFLEDRQEYTLSKAGGEPWLLYLDRDNPLIVIHTLGRQTTTIKFAYMLCNASDVLRLALDTTHPALDRFICSMPEIVFSELLPLYVTYLLTDEETG